jgi:hypothetical protein
MIAETARPAELGRTGVWSRIRSVAFDGVDRRVIAFRFLSESFALQLDGAPRKSHIATGS